MTKNTTIMETSVKYLGHTPEKSDGFYHAACPLLYSTDEITDLSDCPFPLKTNSFEVLIFGKSISDFRSTFAVVRYQKKCGHVVEERISFQEGVEDFEHCGTKFFGADYSIKNWESRIEFFRTVLPCDVCQMVEHSRWIFGTGLGSNSRKKSIEELLFLLNASFANWQNFVSEKEIVAKFAATKRDAE